MPPKLGSVDDALRPLMELAELAAPEEEDISFTQELLTYPSPRQKRAKRAADAMSRARALQMMPSPCKKAISAPAVASTAAGPGEDELLKDFKVTDVLSKMADRSVLLAEKRRRADGADGAGSCQVALKIIQKHRLTSAATSAPSQSPVAKEPSMGSEAELMRQLKHPNIVQLQEVLEDEDRVCLVMEYISGGDMLQDLIRQGRFLEPHARRLLKELGSAMEYVHSRNIVHRDLKPENLLRTSSDRATTAVKISDFGISRWTMSSQDCRTYLGSRDYRAPEVIHLALKKGRRAGRSPSRSVASAEGYGKPADLWSLGVVVYVMLSGERAFESQNKVELEIVQGLWSFSSEVWQSISAEAKDLVSALMQQEPKKRLTAAQLLQHCWLNT